MSVASASNLNVDANNISVYSNGTTGVYLNNTPASNVIAFSATETASGAAISYRQSGAATLSIGSVSTNNGNLTIDPPADTVVNGTINLGTGNFLAQTNGAFVLNQNVAATRTFNADLVVTAGTAGTTGNGVTIQLVDGGAGYGAPAVTAGAGTNSITVTADLSGTGTNATNAQIATALNGVATGTAGNLVVTGGITPAQAQGATGLINGANAATAVITAKNVTITANDAADNVTGHEDVVFNQSTGAVTGIVASGTVNLTGYDVLFNNAAADTAGSVIICRRPVGDADCHRRQYQPHGNRNCT